MEHILYVAAGAALLGSLAALRGLRRIAWWGLGSAGVITAAASLRLFLAFYRSEFSFLYVVQYSEKALPTLYRISAFWAGQAGSYLLWSLLTAILALSLYKRLPVLGWYGLLWSPLLFLTAHANPLARGPVTIDGLGLNPLLQNFWMASHPPLVFLGYAASATLAAWALAVLAQRDWRERGLRSWALMAWLTLGAGILLGGYWAYRVLSWGGYWTWDPVENSSLIPWLIMGALVHSLRGWAAKRWLRLSLVLSLGGYFSILVGTFLIRSGVLSQISVHAFTDLGSSRFLLLWVIGSGVLFLSLLSMRWKELSQLEVDRPNKAWYALGGAWILLLLSGAVVAVGTLVPVVTGMANRIVSVDRSYYQLIHLVLIPVWGLLLAWSAPRSGWAWALLIPAGLGLAWVVGLRLQHYPYFLALVLAGGSILAHWRWQGKSLAHLGLVLLLIGALFSTSYEQRQTMVLSRGEETSVLGYPILYTGYRLADAINLQIPLLASGREVSLAMRFHPSHQNLMRHPQTVNLWWADLYIAPMHIQASPSETLRLGMGGEGEVEGWGVRFNGFIPQAHQMGQGDVLAAFSLRSPQGEEREVQAGFSLRGPGLETLLADLPGGGQLEVVDVQAQAGQIGLRLWGVTPSTLGIQASLKPLVSLVWLGSLLILLGLSVAWKESASRRENPSDR